MFAAIALVAYLVQPGDTLSGISASHGTSLAAVEAANPQISNPNLIYAGQSVQIPGGSSATQGSSTTYSHAASYSSSQSAPSAQSTSSAARTVTGVASSTQAASSASSGYSSSSLSDIPGVPQSFAACVAYRESTDLQNPAANGNAYGILPSSGINVEGQSLSAQKAAFAQLYKEYGTQPWAPSDGC